MADDTITIEVDGRALSARKGAMLIEVTDAADIHIPRFCYHDKLTVAANCRMCLVEVEKAPKPLPACATPVMDGMKVFTRSARAIAAQKGTMEFLLINHPLDCPICDQGGECELQDVAMGYGHGVSRYTETKRVVFDRDIGPLVATEMTRCIHCTRCVRFGEEIAGLRELGATGRGEDMRIGTYVQRSVVSELSGNIVDLCPVGALTAKPSRYTARAWELTQAPGVAAHDCIGSNLYYHLRDRRVMRVVPRECEPVNEVWLADRDRYSYTGLGGDDRLRSPMLRDGDEWREVDWDEALAAAAAALAGVPPDEVGFLAAPGNSLEEHYLLQRLARGLGCGNIDHRLRQADFSTQDAAPVMPWLGQNLTDLEHLEAVLVVAGNVRLDQPLLAHRLRKAARRGAAVSVLNVREHEQYLALAHNVALSPAGLIQELAGIARALAAGGAELDPATEKALARVKPNARQQAMAERLRGAANAAVLLGSGAPMHPAFGVLQAWAWVVSAAAQARFGNLSEGGNAAGAWLAGCLPHRGPAGAAPGDGGKGLHALAMLEQPRRVYLLQGIEPEFDFGHPATARAALAGADQVIALTTHTSPALLERAAILLPTAAAAETDGTLVNVEGRWQSVRAAAAPPGQARAGWKVLRVLANRLGLGGFDFLNVEAVRAEVRAACDAVRLDNALRLPKGLKVPGVSRQLTRVAEVPPYAVDMIVRRAAPLQATPDAGPAVAALSPAQAQKEGLQDGGRVRVRQGEGEAVLEVVVTDAVANGCVWIPAGVPGSETLGPAFGPVELAPA